jgi:cysteine-rich repeat protein
MGWTPRILALVLLTSLVPAAAIAQGDPPGDPVVPWCGNCILEWPEQCDDCNTVNGDGCRDDCTAEICGDGILDPQEQCDDGNTVPGDGCSADCAIEACGNGVVDPGEECDDGNTDAGDGCNEDCQIEVCGNGVVDAGEECDDGTPLLADGCTATCRIFCNEPVTEVLVLADSGIAQAYRAVIDNETDWCSFWDDAYSGDPAPPPCDVSLVDFSTEIVLVGALGEQPDACHAARMICADRVGTTGSLRAVLTHEQPGANCSCDPGPVRPVVAAKVGLPTAPVRILYEPTVVDCP